jgi:hypothetical protein
VEADELGDEAEVDKLQEEESSLEGKLAKADLGKTIAELAPRVAVTRASDEAVDRGDHAVACTVRDGRKGGERIDNVRHAVAL